MDFQEEKKNLLYYMTSLTLYKETIPPKLNGAQYLNTSVLSICILRAHYKN